ncbi:hypothetical protein TL16_g05940 [Triparma laevis f. inornata]|uniref:SRCR domain-containing protein n=1 Tax=Triparma laevis f. inornata TaxID=1714386 RepID=A0A9W7AHT6_9STRA|nr:hypothetical protein TL16_g05940 [Triparma laevis f. inornata]
MSQALVVCKQIGDALDYLTVSANALSDSNTPDGSLPILWSQIQCQGDEASLDDCEKEICSSCWDHSRDVGVECTFFPRVVACNGCAPGKFAEENGECVKCGAGRFSASSGASTCDSCAAGKSSSPGSSACTPCTQGKYSQSGSLCVNCPAGKYGNEEGLTSEDSCTSCELGKASDILGVTECTSCSQGEYASETGQQQCTSCSAGKASDSTVATSPNTCIKCSPGKYSADIGSISCNDCDSGKYNKHTNSSSLSDCLRCEAGHISQEAGAEECTSCPQGTYQYTGNTHCADCEAGKVSAVGSNNCIFCEDGTYLLNGGLECALCEYGKSYNGGRKCTDCYMGRMSESRVGVCKLAVCMNAGEESVDGQCEICDQASHVGFICFSLLTFFIVGKYVNSVSHHLQKMVRIKTITNFYQTTDLTTLVAIPWPSIVYNFMPFEIPSASFKCLADWNFFDAFYFFACLALATFGFIILLIGRHRKVSLRREQLQQLLVFLLTLGYAPLLQAAASTSTCHRDYGRDMLVYDVDPTVECPEGPPFFWYGALLIVGLAYPLFIFMRIEILRRRKKLVAKSAFFALFQWYTPSQPWFDVVQLLRKLGLIFVTVNSDWGNSVKTSVMVFGINFLYLLLVLSTRPFKFFPSSTLKGHNLFSIAEVLSTLVTIVGASFAIIAAVKQDRELTNMLGFGFVVLNVLFSIILFFWFKVDMKVSKQTLTPKSRRIKSILEEYDVLVKLISMFELNVNLVRGTSENTSYSNDHSDFKQIASSLPFYRSRVLGEMATILSAYSEVVDDFLNAERMIMTDTIEEMTGEKYREIFESMDSVCKRMNESVEDPCFKADLT